MLSNMYTYMNWKRQYLKLNFWNIALINFEIY